MRERVVTVPHDHPAAKRYTWRRAVAVHDGHDLSRDRSIAEFDLEADTRERNIGRERSERIEHEGLRVGGDVAVGNGLDRRADAVAVDDRSRASGLDR
jgi:hypothetical protein